MKNLSELLSQLRHLQIKLWLEEGKLRYQAPQGALTPALKQELIQYKSEIITFLQKAQTSKIEKESSIPVISRQERQTFPLSFSQERLWFLHQLQAESSTYNMPTALQLDGNLDVSALVESFNELLRRHETLRTRFINQNDQVVQIIDSSVDFHLEIVDLCQLDLEEKHKEINKYVNKENHYSFKLNREHLMRAALLKLDEDSHILLVNIHHIIGDGWTGGRLVEELSQLYEAFHQNISPSLPKLPIQYADYAVWQRQWIESKEGQKQQQYWQEQLFNIPELINLPTDFPRPSVQSFQGKTYQLELPSNLIDALKKLSQQEGVTLFVTFLTALKILLNRWTKQEDLVVGTVIAGRNRVETELLVGCLMNFLALRNQLTTEITIQQLLQQENQTVLEAYSNQDFPFEKVVEILNPERNTSHNPIYNVGLLLQNFPHPPLFGNSLQVNSLETDHNIALLDLRWIITELDHQIIINCEYSTDLFTETTIQELVKNYLYTLEQMTENLGLRIEDITISQLLKQQAQQAKNRDKKQNLVIAATFTANSIEASLSYWMNQLNLPSDIHLAPYNQVFQELLNPQSEINQNSEGINLILIRPEDWVRFDSAIQEDLEKWQSKIRQTSNDLMAALQKINSSLKVPLILIICPYSPHLTEEKIQFLRRIETLIISQLQSLNRIHLIDSFYIEKNYSVTDFYDVNRDELGHIPYTETYYTALGTAIARKIYALKHSPYKVIALDCDNTLWTGICGEDGAKGVKIDEPRQVLQNLLVEQQKAGKLLCLCSKNQEDDVWAVFDAHSEMPLRKEHLVDWQINWQPKSENLEALAKNLNLGLESFILIDDNPVECAEVQANCPEVLTLQLPENPQDIAHWLKHIWAFDWGQTTVEDQKRTEMYRQNLTREQLKQESLTFQDFLTSLNLDISIDKINVENLPRVSQLTQRTNQFNVTTIRRSEGEIQQLLDKGELLGRVVTVKDRFGDYGLVGVLLFKWDEKALTVDTFLLSCRVLGRGVEYEMVRSLGRFAKQHNVTQIKIPYYPTAKNQPALDFLEKIGTKNKQQLEQGWLFEFTTEELINISFIVSNSSSVARQEAKVSSSQSLPIQAPSELLNQIATQFTDPTIILQAVEAKQQTQRSGKIGEYVAPRNEIEQQLSLMWMEVLKVDKVGIYDNFFKVGGNSLLATQVISRMRDTFAMNLPLGILFENPTIANIGQQIQQTRSTYEKLQPDSNHLADLSDNDVEEFDL